MISTCLPWATSLTAQAAMHIGREATKTRWAMEAEEEEEGDEKKKEKEEAATCSCA